MRKSLVGQIQRPGSRPIRTNIVGDDNTPIRYSVRHLNVDSSSGTLTLDLGQANSFACTLTENVTTIDINGPMATDEYWEFHLELTQDSTARTVTWAAKFEFPGGTDHTMSTGSGDVDAIHGYSTDGGTTWKCTFVNAFA